MVPGAALTMVAKAKQLAGQSSLYTLGEVVRSGIAFLLLPLYTRLLSPADYAILGVTAPLFSLLTILMALGMPTALVRCYFDYRQDPEALRRYVGTVAVFGLASGLAGALLLTFLGPALLGRLVPNTPFHPYVLLTVWNAGLSVVSALALQLFRAQQQAHRFVAFSLADAALTAALVVALVAGVRLGALGSLWGQLLAALVMAGPALWALSRAGRLGFSWALLRPSLLLGLPLLPSLLGAWALNVSDRVVLDRLVTREAIGLYTLSYQFGVLLNIVAMALNNAWQPFFFQHAAEGGHDRLLGILVTYQAALMAALALAVALLAPEVIRLIAAPAYWPAAKLVPWIAAGYAARHLAFFPVGSLLYRRAAGWIAGLTVAAAALNIGLNLWAVPRFGVQAAAVNTLVAFAALFAGLLVVGQRAYPLRYQWSRLLRVAAAALLLFALGQRLPTAWPLWLSAAAKLALLAALPLLLWLMGFFTAAERAQVGRVVGRLVEW